MVLPDLTQRLGGQADGSQRRDAGVLDEDVLRRARPALEAVDDDHVGPGGDGQLDVVADPGGPHLHVDGLLPVRGLPELLDLDDEVVGTCPVRVAAGRTLIDAGGQRAHAGDPFADLLAEEHPAASGLGALTDDDLDRVRRGGRRAG